MEFFNDFENFIKVIDNENKEIIITGDFNCDMLQDSNYRNNNSKRLDDLLDIYQLQQHIDKPTRTTDSTKTLIDIIITKSDDTKTSDSGVIALGISDHDLVYICRKIGVPRETPKIVETRRLLKAFTLASRLVKYHRNTLKNNLKHVDVLHFLTAVTS
jgi:hypothetical protein